MFVNIVNTQDGESGAGEVSGQSYDDDDVEIETLGLEYEDLPERKDKIKQEYEGKSEDKEYRKDPNPDSNSLCRRNMT